MKVKEIILRSHAFMMLFSMMLGCQCDKVHYYDVPDDYQFVKRIEAEVLSSETATDSKSRNQVDDVLPLRDHFGFRRANEAYEKGRIRASHVAASHAPIALSAYNEIKLEAQAERDGFEEQLIRTPDVILARNKIRNQLQLEFWGLYRNNMDPQDDLMVEESQITTNCYVHLLSSYEKGYRNGYRVVAKLGKSPIATHYYLVSVNLGSNILRRAYVYGWYSACYDYFCANPKVYNVGEVQSGMDPMDFYSLWISAFQRREAEFLKKNAVKK